MEPNNRHPLEAITNSGSLSMLESLIPFVEYPLKLPLALFIKFNEIHLIINAFRSLDNLTRLGLHNVTNDPMDMVCSMTGISPEMLKMIFSMTENMNDFASNDILSGLTGNSSADFSNFANLFHTMSANQEQSTENSAAFTNHEKNGNSPTDSTHSHHNPVHETKMNTQEDFDLTIQNILAEYDLAQAEQLNQNHTPNEP